MNQVSFQHLFRSGGGMHPLHSPLSPRLLVGYKLERKNISQKGSFIYKIGRFVFARNKLCSNCSISQGVNGFFVNGFFSRFGDFSKVSCEGAKLLRTIAEKHTGRERLANQPNQIIYPKWNVLRWRSGFNI